MGGWESLRALVEAHAAQLRTMQFPHPGLLAALLAEGAASPKDPAQVYVVGNVIMVPHLDAQGYKSVTCRLTDDE